MGNAGTVFLNMTTLSNNTGIKINICNNYTAILEKIKYANKVYQLYVYKRKVARTKN